MNDSNRNSVLMPRDRAGSSSAATTPAEALGTRDRRLKGVTRLAARMFGVALVDVALTDDDRRLSAARPVISEGLPQLKRNHGFASLVMAQPGVLVLDDMREHPTLKDNPHVAGFPFMRFAAGHALRAPDGSPIGALCLYDPEPRQFSPEETDLLRELAEWLEDAITVAQELARASEVQRSLSPRRLLSLPGFDVAGACLPARTVGGDFYDWYPIAQGAAFTLGDVMGKGIGAAIVAATVRAVLRAGSQRGAIVAAVDSAAALLEDDLSSAEAFVTLFHARLDMRTAEVAYIDAGHGLTLVVRADGTRKRLATSSLPLGTGLDASWREHRVSLGHGDTLVSMSDGVLDLFDGTLASLDEVEAIVRSAPNSEAVVDQLIALAGDTAPDDVTVLVVRRD